ncbi:ATP-binding protein [Shimia ponticola]|uniref:ATP-binding protein n=1 Tax=Shimia ponticola TaxID=2582893 RepID=UPI0011BDAE0F|nr:ATP-binding protein [Shimia ponticola]
MGSDEDKGVSRRRYNRAVAARAEAEKLLDEKSRALFEANEALREHQSALEDTVRERTADLQAALQKAQMASEVRARFIATMSHEIRTPLGGLMGIVDLLHMEESDPKKQELLSFAKTSGTALKTIVNDVLDFSKMEAGAFQFKTEQVDIRSLATGVAALARYSADETEREIEVEIGDDVPQRFYGDATRIRQVISNLVSNAVRYSTDGLISVRARMIEVDDAPWLRVEVEDFGVGIAADKRDDLFKDFSQVSNELSDQAQGTGLGLAISRRIIEGANGHIGVDSELGVGSTFWFEIPIEEVPHAPLSDPTTTAEVDNAEDIVRGARVLLAEDNTINQTLLMRFLKKMGVVATLAENGQVAVDLFRPGAFDLILMDVAMPVMDGLQAIRHIRDAHPPDQVPPISLLTAHVMETVADDAIAVGVEHVLSKPIAFDDLRLGIASLMTGRKVHSLSLSAPQAGSHVPVMDLMSEDISAGLAASLSGAEIEELAAQFVTDAESLWADVMKHSDDAASRGNCKAPAHALKGAAGLLGFATVSEHAAMVEESCAFLDAEDFDVIGGMIASELDRIRATLPSGASA